MANSTAEFDCAALVRKFKPLIEPTMSTPGVLFRTSRTCLATASVRCKRGAIRQLDDDEEIALVLDRQEGRGNARARRNRSRPAPPRTAPSMAQRRRISMRTLCGIAHATASRSRVLNQRNGANVASPRWRRNAALKRRAERQRVEGGDADRDRDRQRELVVEPAGDAGNEGDRDEHRHQHRGRGDDRAGDFLHRRARGCAAAAGPPRAAARHSRPRRSRRRRRGRSPAPCRAGSAC